MVWRWIMATKKSTTVNPIQVKEKMLKAYMRRQVSGMGTLINAVAYVSGIEPRDVYNSLAENFANPRGYRREGSALGVIDDDIRDVHKSQSVYNYFDLDTLISYGRFLQKALENVNAVAASKPRGKVSSRDFFSAIGAAQTWMMKNKGKVETGYYDPDHPIGYLRDDAGRLAPESTISMQDFDKRYNETVCEEALEDYVDFGLEHGELITHGGKKYEINTENYHRTYPDDYSVRFIRACRRDGMLFGYVDQANNPFFGDVYNIEDDQFVYYDTADGLEVMDRGNTPGVKSFNKLYRRSSAQSGASRYYSQDRSKRNGKGGK